MTSILQTQKRLSEPSLFDNFNVKHENDWRDEWHNMPEYDNKKSEAPYITATFKFRNQEDFDKFNTLLKKYMYEGQKPFDGMQRKTVKSTWYPLNEKASKYRYVS